MLTKIFINELNSTFMIIMIIFWVEIACFHSRLQYSYPKKCYFGFAIRSQMNTQHPSVHPSPTPHAPLCLSLILFIHHFWFTWTTCQQLYKSEPKNLIRDKLLRVLFFEIFSEMWKILRKLQQVSYYLKGRYFIIFSVIFYHPSYKSDKDA